MLSVVEMTNKYTDGLGRKWEFDYIKDFDSIGNDYVEIERVWQVVKQTQASKEMFEVHFDVLDSDWIKEQEDRIECAVFGFQVHS